MGGTNQVGGIEFHPADQVFLDGGTEQGEQGEGWVVVACAVREAIQTAVCIFFEWFGEGGQLFAKYFLDGSARAGETDESAQRKRLGNMEGNE